MNYPDLLIYWIKERYAILKKKEQGLPAPWSEDPVFQTTYFCNVRREDDKVTRFIRAMYSPWVGHELFEYNLVLARLLNRPDTLETIGYQKEHIPDVVLAKLTIQRNLGPIWGSAYIITTHGQKMDKLAYLAQVLDLVHERIEAIRGACRGVPGPTPATCHTAAGALQLVDGLGSFLAAQVVADLKNTNNHPLQSAPDWWTFVKPGPGSLRGASWFHNGNPNDVTPTQFEAKFRAIRDYVAIHWPEGVPWVCSQDLQNCLCEFDKYCRVLTGSGRSKRKYAGTDPRG